MEQLTKIWIWCVIMASIAPLKGVEFIFWIIAFGAWFADVFIERDSK